MKLKIMEWNINQRLNFAKTNMPNWISEVISSQNADLIALTEVYKGNNWEDIKKDAFGSNYAVFETSNHTAGQNDIAIAVNVKKVNIIYAKTYYPSTPGIPDYLEIKCKTIDEGAEFIFICTRIHALVNDQTKRNELEHIMTRSKDDDTVLICGDFNNYRRGIVNKTWCLPEIGKICSGYNFVVKTPDGASIYDEKLGKVEYQFAEDHFLLKGFNEEQFTLLPYYRDFVEKDKQVYKWGRDFQFYSGKDSTGNNIYESVPAPFPDHAILMCEIEFKLLYLGDGFH